MPKTVSAKANISVATCPVVSLLVVALFYTGFGLAFTLPRQMLPTGQVPTHCGLVCKNHLGNHTGIVGQPSIAPPARAFSLGHSPTC